MMTKSIIGEMLNDPKLDCDNWKRKIEYRLNINDFLYFIIKEVAPLKI